LAANRDSRNRGRAAMGPDGTAAGRGSRAGRIAERGQIDAADGAQRGAAEDRALPFHHARAEYRARVYFRRGKFHARGYSRADRRSAQGAWAWDPFFAA